MSSKQTATAVPLDLDGLTAELAKKHRVLLDQDDPILILATLTDLATKHATERVAVVVRNAADQISAAAGLQMEVAKDTAERIVTGSGAWIADQVRTSMATCREELLEAMRAETRTTVTASKRAGWSAIIAGGSALVVMGGLAGYGLAILH